jgi:hypothetical protein
MPLTLSAVYCPLRHAIVSREYVDLLESYGSEYLIGGDWNAKHTQWGARLITTKRRSLLEAMHRQNSNYLSTGEPTYWPSDHNKLPDLLDFFIYKGIATHYSQIEPNHELSSDHTPVIATLSTHVINKPKIPMLITNGTNWALFRHIYRRPHKYEHQNRRSWRARPSNPIPYHLNPRSSMVFYPHTI